MDAQTFATQILERVRDPDAAVTTLADTYTILDNLQMIVSRGLSRLLTDNNAFSTPRQTCLHAIDNDVILKIVDMFRSSTGKRMSPVLWRQMIQHGPGWWRHQEDTGDSDNDRQVWAMVGTSRVITWPPNVTVSEFITMRYAVRPTVLSSGVVELEIPDEDFPLLSDLLELVLLIKMRHVSVAKAKLEALEGR